MAYSINRDFKCNNGVCVGLNPETISAFKALQEAINGVFHLLGGTKIVIDGAIGSATTKALDAAITKSAKARAMIGASLPTWLDNIWAEVKTSPVAAVYAKEFNSILRQLLVKNNVTQADMQPNTAEKAVGTITKKIDQLVPGSNPNLILYGILGGAGYLLYKKYSKKR